jgi:hypothetical protein
MWPLKQYGGKQEVGNAPIFVVEEVYVNNAAQAAVFGGPSA